ncbi:hypothetical protein E5676_scaffold1856G00150 [Cucumis melo var. makuwa]|uniref:Uncharacterized protein n=1 Tax=Cucumis melo var. makuwa TaxID=1194695 RepID=A0A5D3C1E6_CUCMM|nr:hypothetical protein E6C27_scaffold43055G00210 [Cucumis melo var. makuwa]TYK04189.1 hypothetical protein E5676_scaffold1856G00150 [Cucumis melo var. makuwa]
MLLSFRDGWRCLIVRLVPSLCYLGIPLRDNPRAASFWDLVCEKIRKRLLGWKKGFFLKAGRLTLIRSVMSGILVYYMSLLRIPSSVCKSMEKYTRDFLWEGVDEGQGSHLVSWELVGRPMYQGDSLWHRKRALLVNPFCCMLCRKAEEDLDHLFWDRHYAQAVWSSFLQVLGVSFAGSRSVRAKIEEFLLHLSF